MFDKACTATPEAIEIRRVRNGFMLTTVPNIARDGGLRDTPYVFTDLRQLYDFLIANDWECTEE